MQHWDGTTFGQHKDTLLGTGGNGSSQLCVLSIADLEIVLLLNISEVSLSKQITQIFVGNAHFLMWGRDTP
jgi:hypothetical protein